MYMLKTFLKKILFIYLFIFRERGREGEREGEKHQGVSISYQHPPTQNENLTGYLSVGKTMPNPQSHTSQGPKAFY